MVMSEAQGLSPSSVPGQVLLPLVLALLQELVTSGEPGDPPENFKVCEWLLFPLTRKDEDFTAFPFLWPKSRIQATVSEVGADSMELRHSPRLQDLKQRQKQALVKTKVNELCLRAPKSLRLPGPGSSPRLPEERSEAEPGRPRGTIRRGDAGTRPEDERRRAARALTRVGATAPGRRRCDEPASGDALAGARAGRSAQVGLRSPRCAPRRAPAGRRMGAGAPGPRPPLLPQRPLLAPRPAGALCSCT
ncbi:hypothetical protein J1605_013457 [Eschrichtius robustus]|uniref:Uncharacterized protein n=1 Tax=Eschrichtius robustus TaxID=9764 RepID=A0AB34GJ95_ESCRO|nr:hypothetical protein J1605_013457 [Eschrichtius robustus]